MGSQRVGNTIVATPCLTRQILGAAVLAVEGGEIMSMLEIAMMAGLPYTALEDCIFAHPALAEGLNTLFTSMEK